MWYQILQMSYPYMPLSYWSCSCLPVGGTMAGWGIPVGCMPDGPSIREWGNLVEGKEQTRRVWRRPERQERDKKESCSQFQEVWWGRTGGRRSKRNSLQSKEPESTTSRLGLSRESDFTSAHWDLHVSCLPLYLKKTRPTWVIQRESLNNCLEADLQHEFER